MKPATLARRAGSVVLMLVLLGSIFAVLESHIESQAESDANRIVLPALSLAVVVIALGLAAILIRNLVRLIVDRKRGILGARLRTKLVFFFLALVLVPALVLFVGSVQVIKRTGEALLQMRTPLEEVSREVVDQWSDFYRNRCLAETEELAVLLGTEALLDPARADDLRAMLEAWSGRRGLDMIWVAAGDRIVARAEVPSSRTDPEQSRERRAVLEQRVTVPLREPNSGMERVAGSLIAYAVAPVDGRWPGAVAAAIVLPRDVAQRLGQLDAASRDYRVFRIERRELVRFYITLIALVFLATLFLATWIGLYLARRITGPIQEVASATREISAGNLGVRVRARVGDEIGALVDGFNEMAAELQENREVITRSTAELRRSNQALDERRRYIETLVATLSTGVISLDPAGRVTTANPAVESILGLRFAPGDDFREKLERRGHSALAVLIDQAEHGIGSTVRELELSTSGGTLNVTVQISALTRENGEILGSLMMIENMTERMRAQKILAWQEVARRLAHEVKNPLTPIQLCAQRLRKKFLERAPDLDRVLLDSTASIEREVASLKRMVDEFQAFARMPEVRPQPIEFGRVVDSVLGLYQGQSEIHWEVDLDPRASNVVVDPDQMRRALINLIDNAIAAMSGRGAIRIATRALGDTGLRIEVSDSGPGIPAADRDRMFAPDFSTKETGTGLGLAIVQKVITDHRGTIRVEENPPHGARFVIDLPAA